MRIIPAGGSSRLRLNGSDWPTGVRGDCAAAGSQLIVISVTPISSVRSFISWQSKLVIIGSDRIEAAHGRRAGTTVVYRLRPLFIILSFLTFIYQLDHRWIVPNSY